MDESRFKQIIAKLADKEVLHKLCPRCQSKQIKKHDTKFSILGETALPLSVPQDGGSPQEISAVMICCKQCGFILHHALGPLGLD